jgi:hypothetical protein
MKLNITLFLYLFIICSIVAQSDEWIVSYEDISYETISKSNKNSEYTVKTLSKALNIYLITFSNKVDRLYVEDIFGNYATISSNDEVELRRTPDDDLFGQQYHLDFIRAEEAWDITTGNTNSNTDYVIAVIDDGFAFNHPDIIPNLWTNEAEIDGDGIDNDNNGFVDDYLGLNIESNNDDHDIEKHGSQVLGVLGAKGNNGTGISGVMWDADILIISAVSTVAEIIAAMDYIYEMKKLYLDTDGQKGANVVVTNFSGGAKRRFPNEFPAWCAVYDLLGTVGILSVTATANESYDVEEEGDMPTLCDSPYLITVSYTSRTDELDGGSAYGKESVDIAAPGKNILSTAENDSYLDDESGSSYAAPQVAGALGLMYHVDCEEIAQQHIDNPTQLALDMKTALLNGVNQKSSLSETVSGGRLNIFNSILELVELCGGTALSELEAFPLAPNPMTNTDLASMSLDYTTDIFSEHRLIITDVLGQLIYTQNFSPSTFSNKSLSLNQVPYLNSGLYSFSIINENGMSSQTVVVVGER